MILKFQIQGSADDPYEVVFDKSGPLLLGCTCQAGAFGKLCKHLLNLINGEINGIVSGNEQNVTEITNLLVGSEFKHALDRYNLLLAEKEELDKRIKKAKKAVEQLLF